MTPVFVLLALLAQGSIQERLDRVRADLFSRTDRVEEDVKELKAILSVEPKSAEAHALLGIAYKTQGTPELAGESVAEFRQALELDPRMVPVRFYLARVYLDLGRAARAKEEIETALTQSPGNPEFLALLSDTERQLKNPARAVELARQSLQIDESQQTRYYLGLALFDLGKRAEAIKELETVVDSAPGAVEPYLALGTAYNDAGRATDAVRLLAAAAKMDPARPEAHIQLARAYRMKGLLDRAEAQLALAAPKPGAGKTQAAYDYQRLQIDVDLYLERGLLKLQRGQLAAAADAFKKVLAMDSDNQQAKRGLADVERKQKAGAKK